MPPPAAPPCRPSPSTTPCRHSHTERSGPSHAWKTDACLARRGNAHGTLLKGEGASTLRTVRPRPSVNTQARGTEAPARHQIPTASFPPGLHVLPFPSYVSCFKTFHLRGERLISGLEVISKPTFQINTLRLHIFIKVSYVYIVPNIYSGTNIHSIIKYI